MSVQIKLSTTLRDCVPGYVPEQGLIVELDDADTGITAGELARRIGLPIEEIKIVMINGRQSETSSPVRDGDRVAYFPAVGGG